MCMDKKTLKLAAFGDSYADFKGPIENEGWHYELCQLRNWDMHTETLNTGESGAGNWWGYLQFIHTLESHHIENVVFSFTDIYRLPIANPNGTNFSFEYLGYCHWQEHGNKMQQQAFKEEIDKRKPLGTNEQYQPSAVVELWQDLFDTQDHPHLLTNFIARYVYHDVVRLCKEHNINLVALIPFDAVDYGIKSTSDVTVQTITAIDKVSHLEQQSHNPDILGLQWITQPFNDERTNHLNNNNNKILAEYINKGLLGEAQLVDFSLVPGLDTSIESMAPYCTFTFANKQ
jgi:hypothetical protein